MAKTTWLINSTRLKGKIDSRHLTYQAAANLAGLSHATIVRLMKGDCFVTPKAAEKIMAAFGSKNDTQPIACDLANTDAPAWWGDPEEITEEIPDDPAESNENTITPDETAKLDEKKSPAAPVNRFEGCPCRGATLRDLQNSINAALLQFERKGMALVRINMAQVETGGYRALLTFEPEY